MHYDFANRGWKTLGHISFSAQRQSSYRVLPKKRAGPVAAPLVLTTLAIQNCIILNLELSKATWCQKTPFQNASTQICTPKVCVRVLPPYRLLITVHEHLVPVIRAPMAPKERKGQLMGIQPPSNVHGEVHGTTPFRLAKVAKNSLLEILKA